jgi:hypothetical protein
VQSESNLQSHFENPSKLQSPGKARNLWILQQSIHHQATMTAIGTHSSTSHAHWCCSSCDRSGSNLRFFVTRRSNRNGNAGRPYVKCGPCDKFIAFRDTRGIHHDDPHCDCNTPARLQVAGKSQKTTPRGLHYVCGTGRCDHYSIAEDEAEEQYRLPEQVLEMLVRLSII